MAAWRHVRHRHVVENDSSFGLLVVDRKRGGPSGKPIRCRGFPRLPAGWRRLPPAHAVRAAVFPARTATMNDRSRPEVRAA